jgi:hypothetical protein
MPTKKKRILVISYDEALLVTRKLLFESAGFVVTSAYGRSEASRISRYDTMFDLVVMGHSVPQADKKKIVKLLKPKVNAPVLSIRKHYESPLPDADFSVSSDEGPGGLVTAAKLALGIAG